ncbi:MAG: VWA domain-containing protein [Halanaerobiales bacterium]|nr:VWA domain-containing protein [Halanaerobiales bacterium]
MLKKAEVIFILDKSGSMAGLEKDTIGGFNATLKEQKELEGECHITTVLFNHEQQVLHNDLPIQEINDLTQYDYRVGGSTALLDTVGHTLHHIKVKYAETLKENRPEKVLFVISTDGYENSSREYSYNNVKGMIQETQKKYDWEFLFLGANINAFDIASRIGIKRSRTSNYHHDKRGSDLSHKAMGKAIKEMRVKSKVTECWKTDVESDFKNR